MVSCKFNNMPVRNASSYVASSYACAVSNISLVIPTILMNLSVIMAVVKLNGEMEPYEILIANLALTDLLAGLFSMPSLFVESLYVANLKDPCDFAKFTVTASIALGQVSFFLITAIAIERHIKVFSPFFYNSRVTSSLLAKLMIGMWFVSIAIATIQFFAENVFVKFGTSSVISLLGTAVILICYTKILLRARSIRRQTEAEATRFGQGRMTEKYRNLLFIGGLIFISFFLCYSLLMARSLWNLFGVKNRDLDYIICWAWFCVLLNSLANPIISCVFNPDLKKKTTKLWTCVFRGTN